MKKLRALLMLCAVVFTLCACGNEPVPTTTAADLPTTVQTEPACVHAYAEATCDSPKKCTLCGVERGSALGHDYTEGVCSRCGKEDATYVALLDGGWSFDALNESGSHLECVMLRFDEDGTTYLGAGIYNRLADVPEAERDSYMLDEANWYNYSGEIYYYAGYGVGNTLVYTADGNIITCELKYDDAVHGTLILERTGGNMLTVTYFEGEFSVIYLQVGDVLTCQE